MITVRKLKSITIACISLLAIVSVEKVNAQTFAFRNNLLYDATLTPNLGFDVRLDSKWTAGAVVGLNAWDIDKEKNKKWRHLLIAPNVRRYFGHKSDKPADRSLWGISVDSCRKVSYLELDAIYSHFNVGNTKIPFGLYKSIQDRRLQGDLFALGGKYGYSWILSRDSRLEAEAGIAIGYAWFKENDCDHCGNYYGKGDRIFLLPQLGINVVYIIN